MHWQKRLWNLIRETEGLGNRMIKIVIATSNHHKLREINEINSNPNIEFEVINGNFDPVENGKTFAENARIKAKEAAKITKTYCLADDSGLCVDFLNGNPGIYSARYAQTPELRIEKLLKNLQNATVSQRNAHFTCYMVLVDASGNILHEEEGKVFGHIANAIKGQNGFGYDPVFYLEEYGKTIAELPEEEKNKISHRANALKPMLDWINKSLC